MDFSFGESGLFSADSSQLDFVGLHLLGSIVLEGLEGGEATSRPGSGDSNELLVSVFSELLVSTDRRSSEAVSLPWLEVGLDEGPVDVSIDMLPGRGLVSMPGWFEKSTLPLFPRCKPVGDWTLHLLLTLSDRFIIAL